MGCSIARFCGGGSESEETGGRVRRASGACSRQNICVPWSARGTPAPSACSRHRAAAAAAAPRVAPGLACMILEARSSSRRWMMYTWRTGGERGGRAPEAGGASYGARLAAAGALRRGERAGVQRAARPAWPPGAAPSQQAGPHAGGRRVGPKPAPPRLTLEPYLVRKWASSMAAGRRGGRARWGAAQPVLREQRVPSCAAGEECASSAWPQAGSVGGQAKHRR